MVYIPASQVTPGGTIATGDQFKITLTAASGGTPQTLTVIATGSSLYTLDNLIVTDWNASGNSLFTGTTYGMTATYDPDSQSVHLISKSADAAWSTVAVSEVSGSATFSDELVHNDWSEDGNGNQSVTEYDEMGRVYRTDYPDGMVSGTPTYGIGSYTETLYGANGNAVPSYSVSGQTITAGYEEVDFDQLGNTTESFYDINGKLTDQYEPAVADPYTAEVLGDSPAAYYRLDEASGTTAHDSSGNGNTGTYGAGATLGAGGALTGDSDTAVNFAGSSGNDGNVAIPTFTFSGDFTVEAWTKFSATPDNSDAIVGNGGAGNDINFYAGHIRLWNGTNDVAASSVGVTTGQWEHYVITRQGTAVTIYRDGAVVATGTSSFTFVFSRIGWGNVGGNFAGSLDEVALYTHALSAAQVLAHYDAGLGDTVQPHWNYGYDMYGDEISQTDPKGQTTTWDYDALGNKVLETLPDGQSASWVYDYDFDRLSVSIDFDANAAFYIYEPWTSASAGQVSEIDYYYYPYGSPQYDVYYYYDNLDRNYAIERSGGYDEFYGWDANGNIDAVVTNQGQVNYVYDQATNRLIETWTGTTHSTATTDTLYGYNALGQLASTTVVKQDGAAPALTTSTINYFDADGNSVIPGSNYPTTLYTYDADGNITKVTYPNGTETDTDYSSLWTATGVGGVFGTETITNKRGTLTLSSFAYSFDADRRKISDLEMMTDSGEAATSTALYTWTYDALSRLTSEKYDYGNNDTLSGGAGLTTDDYTDDYTYDLDGNRVLKTVDISSNGSIDQTIYDSYNANNELLAETDNATYFTKYSYDANGSPTTVTTVSAGTTTTNTYGYDPQNQMTSAVINGVTTTYMYSVDNDGRIVSEQTGASTATTYVWDLDNPTGYSQILETWKGGSEPVYTFMIGNTVIGQNVSGAPSYATTYFMLDGEDNTRQLTAYTPSASTTNGHVVGRDDYDAFGNPIKFTASTHAASYVTSSVGYKGTFLDSATGNDIEGDREYEAPLDRFMTQDSDHMFQPGDWDNANLYVSFGGSPLDMSDPTGNDGGLIDTLVSAGIDSVLNSIMLNAISPIINSVRSTIIANAVPSSVMNLLSSASPHILSALFVGGLGTGNIPTGFFGGVGGVAVALGRHGAAAYGIIGGSLGTGGAGLDGSAFAGVLLNAPDSESITSGGRMTVTAPVRYWPKQLYQILVAAPASEFFSSTQLLSAPDLPLDKIEEYTQKGLARLRMANFFSSLAISVSFSCTSDPLTQPISICASFDARGSLQSPAPASITITKNFQLFPRGDVNF